MFNLKHRETFPDTDVDKIPLRFDRVVNLENLSSVTLHMGPPLPAKGRRWKGKTDGTDARVPTISGIFWQEYQSRDRVKESEVSAARKEG